MKVLKKICKTIDTVNDALGKLFSLLVIGILGVIMVEVILRRIFSRPQIWTQDMIVMLFACYIILIAAYGFLKKAFVAVDMLFEKLPPRGQYIMHLITYLIFFVPFVFSLLPESWKFFLKSFRAGEKGYSVWAPYTWPEKLCFFIGLLLLAIQGVSEILKQVIGIVEKKIDTPDGSVKLMDEKGGEQA
jgi:TRAP-type mannitol/chloroaromatic compound transport system permease small subunit